MLHAARDARKACTEINSHPGFVDMQDALTKTIPIWAAVVNRAIHLHRGQTSDSLSGKSTSQPPSTAPRPPQTHAPPPGSDEAGRWPPANGSGPQGPPVLSGTPVGNDSSDSMEGAHRCTEDACDGTIEGGSEVSAPATVEAGVGPNSRYVSMHTPPRHMWLAWNGQYACQTSECIVERQQAIFICIMQGGGVVLYTTLHA